MYATFAAIKPAPRGYLFNNCCHIVIYLALASLAVFTGINHNAQITYNACLFPLTRARTICIRPYPFLYYYLTVINIKILQKLRLAIDSNSMCVRVCREGWHDGRFGERSKSKLHFILLVLFFVLFFEHIEKRAGTE